LYEACFCAKLCAILIVDDDFNFSDEESDGNEMEDDKGVVAASCEVM